jgi:hypothetical protein
MAFPYLELGQDGRVEEVNHVNHLVRGRCALGGRPRFLCLDGGPGAAGAMDVRLLPGRFFLQNFRNVEPTREMTMKMAASLLFQFFLGSAAYS